MMFPPDYTRRQPRSSRNQVDWLDVAGRLAAFFVVAFVATMAVVACQ